MLRVIANNCLVSSRLLSDGCDVVQYRGRTFRDNLLAPSPGQQVSSKCTCQPHYIVTSQQVVTIVRASRRMFLKVYHLNAVICL
jgi:hypothetical protein